MATIQIWNLRHTIKHLTSRVHDFHKTRRVQTGKKLSLPKSTERWHWRGEKSPPPRSLPSTPQAELSTPSSVLRQWLCIQHTYSTHHGSLSTQLAPHLDYEQPGRHAGHPLQYSCQENPMDGGVWRAIVHGVAKSWRRLSDLTSGSIC